MKKLFFIFLFIGGYYTCFLKSMNDKNNDFKNIIVSKKGNFVIFKDKKTKEYFQYDQYQETIKNAPNVSMIKINIDQNQKVPAFKSQQLTELWKHPILRNNTLMQQMDYQNKNKKTLGEIFANFFCLPCDIGKSCIEVTCNCLADGCVLCGKCIQTTCQNCCQITKNSCCCCCFQNNNLSKISEKFLGNNNFLNNSLQIEQ